MVYKTSVSSCWILIFFLLVLFLYAFSLDHIGNTRIFAGSSGGKLDTYRFFYQTVRKHLVVGTYHHTYTDNYYKHIRTTILNNLDAKLAAIEKKWEASMSYQDFGTFYSRLRFFFDPLIPYLIPQDKYQQNILSKYDSTKPIIMHGYKVGFFEGDYYPEKGSIVFGGEGGFALDYNNRSIGVDLGEIKSIVAIRLNSWTEKYRIKPSNLSLWASNDNKFYYQYHSKSYIYLNANNIFLDSLNINSRYIKINCNLRDKNYTFAEDFKSILTIFAPPRFRQ